MTDRNQRLHELMGKCWHEWEQLATDGQICKKCKEYGYYEDNPDYTQWEHYGKLLEFVQKQPNWMWFTGDLYEKQGKGTIGVLEILLDPIRGCEAIDKYFTGERK